MTRQITAAGLALVKGSEDCRLTAYHDPSGVLTIGWGHAGADVAEGETITQARADELLASDLAQFEAAVDGETHDVATSDGEFSALVSLAYNIGEAAFKSSSVLRLHRAGDKAGAAQAFLLWDKAHVNGQLVELPGLDRRREAERALYLGGAVPPAPLPAPAPQPVPVPAPAPPSPIHGGIGTGGAAGLSFALVDFAATLLASYGHPLPGNAQADLVAILTVALGFGAHWAMSRARS